VRVEGEEDGAAAIRERHAQAIVSLRKHSIQAVGQAPQLSEPA
jgi:hypothetical protein